MKVHLNQIPPEGLQLEGEEDCPLADLESEGIRCAGPMRYKIDIGISGHELWANGSISQPVEVTCVSCLEKFVYDVRVPAFAVMRELHGPEVVDLTPAMREDILLNLTAHPRCDSQGGRECKGAASQRDTSGEDRQQRAAKREHDWGALDKLDLKKR
jgi:uncharacterized metal-binding protein YceD (DUF177 family)